MKVDVQGIIAFVIILLVFILLGLYIMYIASDTFPAHSDALNATNEILGRECNGTEITYYRYQSGFLGLITSVETTEENADYEMEKCIYGARK